MAEYRGGMNVKQLHALADQLHTKKQSLLTLHQEIAENFYPERADFTVRRYLGDDFAGNLTTSYPILVRRDLTDQIGSMLRPTRTPWMEMTIAHQTNIDHESKQWLEWATNTQRKAMYSPATLFTKATKQVDADFATFGQGVMTVRMNSRYDDMIYRCWHLRDLAWLEDEDGKICAVFRRWKPSVHTLCRMFDKKGRNGMTVHPEVRKVCEKEPHTEVNCYHMMVSADMYDGDAKGMEWRSIYYDVDHEHDMQNVPQRRKEYVIPRWLTVSGSQYAHSPATVAGLPEARLLQAMTYTLLQAGEKVVDPPMVAAEQVLRSDVAIYAGGVTWIDSNYDERSGAALRALTQDSRGMPLSKDMQADSRNLIGQCFYLNKLTLPQRGPEMTAYEVGQRVQEYIRGALPLFEPMESEYNGEMCMETFRCMMEAGGFGSPMDMPDGIKRAMHFGQMDFKFMSPLHDAEEQTRGQKFLEVSQMLAAAVAMDKRAGAVVDVVTAFRDTITSIGAPMAWQRSEVEAQQMIEANAQAQQQAMALEAMQKGAGVAKDLASANSMAPGMGEQLAAAA